MLENWMHKGYWMIKNQVYYLLIILIDDIVMFSSKTF